MQATYSAAASPLLFSLCTHSLAGGFWPFLIMHASRKVSCGAAGWAVGSEVKRAENGGDGRPFSWCIKQLVAPQDLAESFCSGRGALFRRRLLEHPCVLGPSGAVPQLFVIHLMR